MRALARTSSRPFGSREAETRSLRGAVVVIVGASSGVGRAAAVAFAREGASLVLAARRTDLLEEVRRDCEKGGGEAIVVPADAGDAGSVRNVADAAVSHFRRIDVWINNAGVGAVGAFDETPIEAHDQVIRTNLMGAMHGAHAALPYFKQQGRGVIINTNSLGAWAPAPYAAAYSASKFGLRGYAEALRGELSRFPGIHVCDVFPTFLDTPGVGHGANYVGRELKPMPLVKDPKAVAEAMIDLARRPRPTAVVGQAAQLARAAHALAPEFTTRLMARFMEAYFRRAPAAARSDGALFAPQPTGRGVYGGYARPGLRIAAALGVGAVAAAGVLGALALWSRRFAVSGPVAERGGA